MAELSEQQVIDQIVKRLTEMYSGVEPARVSMVVSETYTRFNDSRIRDFVPLFVERHARSVLTKFQS